MNFIEKAAAASAAAIKAASQKVVEFFESLTKTKDTPALPPPAPAKPCPNKISDPAQDPKLHWIKFQLNDDKGHPVPDILVKIKLHPSGSMLQKTSDAKGLVEIRNIEPGTCELVSDWKEHQVNESVFIQ